MTTIFTSTLAGTDGGNNGYSLRDVIGGISANSQGQVRITLLSGGGGGNLLLDHIALGKWNGSGSVTTATPAEVTFSAYGSAHGLTVINTSAGTPYVSDWIDFPAGFTTGDKLVVIYDFNSGGTGGGQFDINGADANGALWGKAASASYNQATLAGESLLASNYIFVSLIETQAAAGAAVTQGRTPAPVFRPGQGPRRGLSTPVAYPVAPVVIPAVTLGKTAPAIFRPGAGPRRGLMTSAAFPAAPVVITSPLIWADGSTLNDNNGIAGNGFQFQGPNATLAGNTLILEVAYPYSASHAVTITDSTGDTWPAAAVVAGTAASSNEQLALYVLPNASAGVHTLTVAGFATSIKAFRYTLSEWKNIATVSPVDGTVKVNSVSGASANIGSFTPTTNNDANGGHLIYQAAISNDTVGTLFANQASAITLTNGAQLVVADNTGTIPSASGFLTQSVNGPINPGFAFTQSTPTNFVGAALALKIDPNAGQSGATFRIVRRLHVSIVNPQTGNNSILFPCDGNLRVATMASGNNLNVFNSVKDSNNSTGYTDRTNAAGESQVFESANTSANNANVITLNLNAGEPQFSVHLLDIIGADPSPFMNTSGFNGAAPSSGSVFNDFPDHTPNASVSGLTIVQTGMGTAGPQFGFAAGAPSGAFFGNVYYTGMTDQDRMDNADPYGHLYFTTNAAQPWNWLLSSLGYGSTAFATAVSYKAAAGAANDNAAASITLGALTTTAAATVLGQATASITLGVLTTTATAVAIDNLSDATSLGPLTVSATATVLDQATASITFGALTTTAAAAALDQAAASITFGALTTTATATALDQAAASITLGALTTTATAAALDQAAASITLGALTTTATVSTGSANLAASITLGALTVSATAGVLGQASASITLGQLTAVGVARAVDTAGGGGVTLDPLTVAATALVRNQASASITLGALTVTAHAAGRKRRETGAMMI